MARKCNAIIALYFSIEEAIGLSLKKRMSADSLTKSRPTLDEIIVKNSSQGVPQNATFRIARLCESQPGLVVTGAGDAVAFGKKERIR